MKKFRLMMVPVRRSALACRVACIAMLCFTAPFVKASDAVQPAQATFSCLRGEGISYINDTVYYRGTSVLFTNCVIYSTTTTQTVQGLTDVTVDVNIGTATTNNHYTGTVQSAAAGTWFLNFTCPTNWDNPYIQIKVTDVNTNVYIYPWKMIHTQSALQ